MKKYNQILLVTLLTLLTIMLKAQNNSYEHLINNDYNFEDQSVISSDDLQNVSVNFGFIFGDFR